MKRPALVLNLAVTAFLPSHLLLDGDSQAYLSPNFILKTSEYTQTAKQILPYYSHNGSAGSPYQSQAEEEVEHPQASQFCSVPDALALLIRKDPQSGQDCLAQALHPMQ